MKPEELAWQKIDELLEAAGWVIQVIREDDRGLHSTLGSKGFDLIDSGSYPIPFSLRKEWSCEIDFHLFFFNPFRELLFHFASLCQYSKCVFRENEIRSFCSCTGPSVGRLCYLVFGFAIMAGSELAQCSL